MSRKSGSVKQVRKPSLPWRRSSANIFLVDTAKDLPPKVSEVLKSSFTLVPSGADLAKLNTEFLEKHSDSPAHLLSGYKTRFFLDPSTKELNEQDLIKTLDFPGVGPDDALAAREVLEEWNSEKKVREEFAEKARGKWRMATRLQC